MLTDEVTWSDSVVHARTCSRQRPSENSDRSLITLLFRNVIPYICRPNVQLFFRLNILEIV
jgi:hypothetical protein